MMAKNYGLVTSAKINVLYNLIEAHPDWGSTKQERAIKEQFGTQLKKDVLLREAAAYRKEKGLERPDFAELVKVLKKGDYTEPEQSKFIEQIKHNYTPEGRYNFVHSDTLKATAKQHKEWLDGLVAQAQKEQGWDKAKAKTEVLKNISDLMDKGEYDPFRDLKEQDEKLGATFSGNVKIRPMKRDYTEARRNRAIAERERATQKTLEFSRR